MRFISAASDHRDIGVAMDEVLDRTADWPSIDLALVFVTPHHRRRLNEVLSKLRLAHPGANVLGCAASGVIGNGVEIEHEPGLAVTFASLPDVHVTPFRIEAGGIPETAEAWRTATGADRALILLSDPFSVDLGAMLPNMQRALPDVPIIGGQASGGASRGDHFFMMGGRVHSDGLVGIGLAGDVTVETAVAQGCRPVGTPMFVTACEGSRILELDGKPPIDVLRELHDGLDESDQALFRESLYLGVQMRDQTEYEAGDFLIRNVRGMVRDGRALAVAHTPSRFEIVQLHVQDADAARSDLEGVLDGYVARTSKRRAPEGALLFSCVGRGRDLFGESNHDSDAFHARFADVPLGGFFGNGEVGPVHGRAFLHGYTSVFGTFRPGT